MYNNRRQGPKTACLLGRTEDRARPRTLSYQLGSLVVRANLSPCSRSPTQSIRVCSCFRATLIVSMR